MVIVMGKTWIQEFNSFAAAADFIERLPDGTEADIEVEALPD